MKQKITEDLYYIGVADRRIHLFENVYPVNDGVTYNSYLLADENPVIFDTADGAFTGAYLENLNEALDGKTPSYLVVQHMEPDHSASIKALAEKYPEMKIVVNAKSKIFLEGFFPDLKNECVVVKDGEELVTGKHTLKFVFAPMVHWPEVMFTYNITDKTLFSADAFGSFGATGRVTGDEEPFDAYIPEARRYYSNIVGKYGVQVTAALKKASAVEIARVCPLHGKVLTGDRISKAVGLYSKWASYTPEQNSVVVAYASVYGNTKKAAERLAAKLGEAGVTDVSVYDVSKTHFSYIIADCFKKSHVVLASVTYNAGIFPAMDNLVREIARHGIANRKFAFIENGSWAAQSAKLMREILSEVKGASFIGEPVSFRSTPKAEDLAMLDALAEHVAKDVNGN